MPKKPAAVMLVLAVLLAVLALGAPAHAKGPIVVVITDTATGGAAALTLDPHDGGFDDLNGLVPQTMTPLPRPALARSEIPAYSLTWLVAYRYVTQSVDVYEGSDGDVYAATYSPGRRGLAARPTWSLLPDGDALTQYLDAALADDQGASAPASPAVAPSVPAVREVVVTQEPAWWSPRSAAWLVPGLVIGAFGVLGLRAARQRGTGRSIARPGSAPV